MADLQLLRFHAESLRDYAVFWFDAEARHESEVSEEEAAYHLCEHAAMLLRYTGREVYLQGLVDQTPEQRQSLVLAVCRYVARVAMTERTSRLLSDDILDADQLTQLEDLVIERDSLEEVLVLATRLSADLLRLGDGTLRRELAMARCLLAELDDVFWERPDAVSVACRALAGLREQLATAPDEHAQWWFGEAVALDETFERGSLQALLNSNASFSPEAHLQKVTPLSASLFARREVTVGLAAADVRFGPPLVSQETLIQTLPGVRAVVTQLNPNAYQFVFIDDQTRERSTRLDGHQLVARRGEKDQARAPIKAGIATLRGSKDFDSCRIETSDSQAVGVLVLEVTKG